MEETDSTNAPKHLACEPASRSATGFDCQRREITPSPARSGQAAPMRGKPAGTIVGTAVSVLDVSVDVSVRYAVVRPGYGTEGDLPSSVSSRVARCRLDSKPTRGIIVAEVLQLASPSTGRRNDEKTSSCRFALDGFVPLFD